MTYNINQEIHSSVSAVWMFPLGFHGVLQSMQLPSLLGNMNELNNNNKTKKKPTKLHMLSIFIFGNLGQIPEPGDRDFVSRKGSKLPANLLAVLHVCGIRLAGKMQNATYFTERTATSTW